MDPATAKILIRLAAALKDEESRKQIAVIIGAAIGFFCFILALPALLLSALCGVFIAQSYTVPCPEYSVITDRFGTRVDPLSGGEGDNHNGLDFAADNGVEVTAARSGTVIEVYSGCGHNYGKTEDCGCGGGYGNFVRLLHEDDNESVYAHLSEITAFVGEKVAAGEKIGAVGSTGKSTGYHLHFEIIIDGEKVDPENYLEELRYIGEENIQNSVQSGTDDGSQGG